MTIRYVLSLAALAAAAVPSAGAAQAVASAQVTVTMPVNLTQLGPGVSKVQVVCNITSAAITNGNGNFKTEMNQTQEYPVSGGAVQTQASLVFSFTNLDNPTGKSANVACSLLGWDQKTASWQQFTAAHADPNFRTNVSVIQVMQAFTW